ncbi:hypothetical protein FRC0036_02128 [Corynebacterium diphtheriae]|nr:hypothetical protein FRC0036_02128 [Corynebacterium diphtheriae]CAB0714270.1 hypothetical protein FRC0025_02155 [Corynebacterium diphtheriae]CAB0776963.1 hypothetical protein FRC0172_01891 [Corynebacterium diphtheriae]CAB0918675.1 hypothetical protein FRC0410_02124 [Corynebacterium diphtheriae]CAB0971125.1 hypothetical protein FRC0457_02073 [Corynebacterium diphtheriae]
MAWLGLVGAGGRATPAHPPKRRHFTPNLLKRPVWKRFGVKCREKCLEIPPFSGSVEPERPSVAPARPTRITRTTPSEPPMLAPPPTSMPNHPKSASPKLPKTPSGNAGRNVMTKPLVRPPSTPPRRPPVALPYTPPPSTPEKTALHTKSSQTAGLEAIWCEVPRKILRNTPVWWLFRF